MSKRAGAVSGETREAILEAAREEFLEYGFRGSSLRRISSKAGVTTGAVYFFFTGKDELFETVISGVTEPFLACMRGHYAQEHDFLSRKVEENQEADIDVSMTLIDFYFQNQATWDILRNHLDHPAVRSFLDRFIDESTEHYAFLIGLSGQVRPRAEPLDRFAIHQFVHMQVDTMLTLISHGFSREEMQVHSRTVTKMLRAAFQSLLT